ncbi:hypothetical protein V6N12_028810 [Hibiscus sabdariffa]|uniref:Uncharacterized protein n=1 Tax=Hibiscus sabdariffa TaxID=183260 RepID=A0ABR2F6V9_9ROSI
MDCHRLRGRRLTLVQALTATRIEQLPFAMKNNLKLCQRFKLKTCFHSFQSQPNVSVQHRHSHHFYAFFGVLSNHLGPVWLAYAIRGQDKPPLLTSPQIDPVWPAWAWLNGPDPIQRPSMVME